MAEKRVEDLSQISAFDDALNTVIVQAVAGTKAMPINVLTNALVKILVADGGSDSPAGMRNNIYRGKNIGTSLTTEQSATIQDGIFDDMFIGDYWLIGEVKWRIAHFDYWLNTGDTACTSHHVVIVPDSVLNQATMNDTNITTGGYIGSKMYTTNLASAKTTINGAFGSSHILSHRELLSNAVSTNAASGWAWYDSTVEIMNESMVYGSPVCSEKVAGGVNYNVGIDKTQLALFRLRPELITNRADWWLRCVMSSASFALVGSGGTAGGLSASDSIGVRPVFAIH